MLSRGPMELDTNVSRAFSAVWACVPRRRSCNQNIVCGTYVLLAACTSPGGSLTRCLLTLLNKPGTTPPLRQAAVDEVRALRVNLLHAVWFRN